MRAIIGRMPAAALILLSLKCNNTIYAPRANLGLSKAFISRDKAPTSQQHLYCIQLCDTAYTEAANLKYK